jgi:hypothetical protein
MNILLGTHHLEGRAGSELFTAELASAFQARGHAVSVFTFFKGPVAEEIQARGIPVFDPDDQGTISRLAPDIVQTNHIPCAHYLRHVIPDGVRAHAILGVFPHLETPPLDGEAYSIGLVVSEEVLDRVNRTSFGKQVEIEILRNWFNDKMVVPAVRRNHPQTVRVAVVSNHIAPELTAALAELQAAGRVDVDYFGVQRKSVVVDGDLLTKYDLIVSIGRTVLLAAACGVPCVMADIYGSDGLLTADNLDLVRTVNFSGRLKRHPITATHLHEELSKLHSYDREQLRRRVTSEHSLNCCAERLLSRYETLLADQRRRQPLVGPQLLPPGEGLVHAEITGEVRQLRKALIETQSKLRDVPESAGLKKVPCTSGIRGLWNRGLMSLARMFKAGQPGS